MKKKTYSLVLMLSLFGSMAFAKEKDKAKPEGSATARQAASASQDTPCGADKQKNKEGSKPALTNQEKEFDRVLQGIYG
jgi:hypothetical protein